MEFPDSFFYIGVNKNDFIHLIYNNTSVIF